MDDLTEPQRKAWATRVKAALIDAGADIAQLATGATRIKLQGNLIVVNDLGDLSQQVFNRLIHRSN